MSDALERAILEGASVPDALAARERREAATPPRTPSPSTSDELGSDLSHHAQDDDDGAAAVPQDRPGANTGPKGVRADARAAAAATRAQRAEQVQSTNERMQRMALTSDTTWEEDVHARSEEAELERLRAQRLQELQAAQAAADERRRRRMAGDGDEERPQGARDVFPAQPTRRKGVFGHLREVDEQGYVDAIDREASGTSVVIHLYEKFVPACVKLTHALASLARLYPSTKFLQARASAIGFGSGSAPRAAAYDDDEDTAAREAREESAAELVPTLLIYRAGELVANLVRVDLEEGWGTGEERDVRDLLAKYSAIDSRPSVPRAANDDDEEDD